MALQVPAMPAEDRAAILASPHLAGLRELEVTLQLAGPAAVTRLAPGDEPLLQNVSGSG